MKTQKTHLTQLVSAIATLAVNCALTLTLYAGKPPGGGGGTPPPGTVYFYSPLSQGDGFNYKMKADGTQKTRIGITYMASPSRIVRGGKTWFLQNRMVSNKVESFAVSEDGTIAVQLTDDPDTDINLGWTPVETPSEAIVAGLGRRWNADGSADVASMGVYIATLRFDADGNVLGLDAAPSFLVSIGVIGPDSWGNGYRFDTSAGFSLAPDLSRIVVDHLNLANGLRIIDVATGAETPLVSGRAIFARWAPDGAKIAFIITPGSSSPARMDVISPNGTGRATIFKARWTDEFISSPSWSPDSAYLAFTFSENNQVPDEDEIYRVTVDGGKTVNLTADISIGVILPFWR